MASLITTLTNATPFSSRALVAFSSKGCVPSYKPLAPKALSPLLTYYLTFKMQRASILGLCSVGCILDIYFSASSKLSSLVFLVPEPAVEQFHIGGVATPRRKYMNLV